MGLKKTVIVGYDAVSSLGAQLDAQWRQAVAGKSGIGRLTRFPLSENFPVRVAGEVEEIDPGPYPFLQPREMAHWTSPIFKYALLVVHRALQNSGIEITRDIAPRVAVTFSSAVGGLDAVLQADRLMVKDGKLPHPFTNPNSCINMVGGKISILTGATGPICSTITACATGITSMIIGEMLLQRNMADVVIAGAVDFPLVEPIVAGFATMNGAYRPKEGQPEEPPEKTSRPFSANRRGFVVSEGAGCIILATGEFAKVHGLPSGMEMAGWAMTSDASHFVSPNLATVRKCIEETIANAGLKPEDIDAVNAHATSTKIGDKVEADALKNIFGGHVPPVSANKSQMGHAMGASSAIEAILAMEGMKKEIVLPTINYRPDQDIAIDCVAEGARNLKQEFVLKNAFGFGGCNSCIILHRTE
ncbi:MAG TPA: beta-ketoacyl-[acyl-carrier-protein] synthase family protein [Smithella sp.]|jgi:3-oxoacyl-[acyl-carrier-protein] synthase II|nr:beta-ketoacyl-[acyl-carrier-protein] synthase family protein [Smithella sp.]HOG09339.1 beta-ketoacyl-[acyl-carrier-protein] synthase family protein [Smithella sp.]HOS13091.1 beta-ketoacyl-[acyl-carrier-protein] synthase family protein [Smithella sp.]HPK21423.1 beta-ketoacyl-[acyl-carrier-protein] synthase family protein [Smithella sp.]HPL46898.1 beta-ketoacyl-[acyl-carrier-protein] synthase family protein [Smithella sp.]